MSSFIWHHLNISYKYFLWSWCNPQLPHSHTWPLTVNNHRNGPVFWQHLTRLQSKRWCQPVATFQNQCIRMRQITLEICICSRVWNSMQCLKKHSALFLNLFAAGFLKGSFCGGVGVWSDPSSSVYHLPQTEACFIPDQSVVRSLPTYSTALACRTLWDPN